MAYRLWLPGDPDPDEEPSETGRSPETGPSPASGAAAPTPHELFLSKVAPAFQRMNQRLLPLLADRWLGASDKIRRHAPDIDQAISQAAERADARARDFMAGSTTEAHFLAAVAEYEEAWRQGAAVVDAVDAAGSWRQACAGCGTTDATVMVHLEDNVILCRRCWTSGGAKGGVA
ncbi:MAG: hypothetical protein QOD39_868 [Mycobacterium sp.]|nr:hypothetical protein [Mycobacterium sp.]